MFGEALRILNQASPGEQYSREGQFLKARLLIQAKKGAEAVAVLRSLHGGHSPEKAERLLALGLAYTIQGDLKSASLALDKCEKMGGDADLVGTALAIG
jgi:hypothetical protein